MKIKHYAIIDDEVQLIKDDEVIKQFLYYADDPSYYYQFLEILKDNDYRKDV